MTALRVAVLAALVSGCGHTPTTPEGVAFLEVAPPTDLTLEIGDTVRFRARALDESGAPLPDILIRWRTPDDTVITIGETSGLVTALGTGSGRVQAVVGDDALVSDFITVSVTAPPANPARR